MDELQKRYFKALTEHRKGLASALEDPALKGFRKSVVEKYEVVPFLWTENQVLKEKSLF